MKIDLTAENLNALATRVAGTASKMGFTKNGKAMATSQGLKLLAALAGYREEHSLVAALKAETAVTSQETTSMQEEMDALESRFGHEHTYYTRADWQQDVSQGNTRLGYWEWVVHALEANGGEEEHCSDCGTPLGDDSWDGKCDNCADHQATVEDLQDAWGDEHGFYSQEDWGLALALEGVVLGYWEWVKNKIEANGGDACHCTECGFHIDDPKNLKDGVCASCRHPSLQDIQRRKADQAYEEFDFSPQGKVVEHDGWEMVSNGHDICVMSRTVYIEQDPAKDSVSVRFRVVFDKDEVTLAGLM